ncbi:hypothetical protein ASPZODRAFT_170322 [Penicilliopsis zonata CBS 506.65]|uniref:Apple domain-containing protein n=1 Tax=Penicilliopsis zonata CBS 506.65 TaxID=1073090 RepID=A0A1L9S4W1_9EURO|nr:hypothetical protein ASPZODRAFT_170322 [Penicilliopsis zonata CBS 506.65]OJJ42209.1 hypothetical protein ASPZODRAFT_170322 [Penicilliopsis zonata CBS 506.65]
MRVSVLLPLLPLLVAGQTTPQQEYDSLCGAGQTTGTTTLGGAQYTYHCNMRASNGDNAGMTSGVNTPADCASRAAGNSALAGVSWTRGGKCVVANSGPPVPQANTIFFEKVVTPTSPCCQERDDCRTQLQACETARDQYKTERDQFKAERDTCRAGGSTTPPVTGGGSVPDCRGQTGNAAYTGQSQAGSLWSVNCNMAGGTGLITRPGLTVPSLKECVDACAAQATCKVATVLPQARNNCLLYTTQSAYRAQTGAHIAVR